MTRLFSSISECFLKRYSVGFLVLLLSFCVQAQAATPLNINHATAGQFAAVMSGVGMAKAEAIVTYRETNGDFVTVEDLIKVRGIGPALLAKNAAYLTVEEMTVAGFEEAVDPPLPTQ